MSQALEMTPADLRKAGWNALKERLGIPEALRFLLQYEKGEGDYTELRRELYKGEGRAPGDNDKIILETQV